MKLPFSTQANIFFRIVQSYDIFDLTNLSELASPWRYHDEIWQSCFLRLGLTKYIEIAQSFEIFALTNLSELTSPWKYLDEI